MCVRFIPDYSKFIPQLFPQNRGGKPVFWQFIPFILWAKKREYSTPTKQGFMSNGDYTRPARVALERECAAVASATQTNRSNTLRRSAFLLGQLIPCGALSENEVFEELQKAATVNGHIADDGQAQIDKTIRGGIAAGMAKPRNVQASGERSASGKHASGFSSPTKQPERQAQETEQASDKWLERSRVWFDTLNSLPDNERAIAERRLLERGLNPHFAYTVLGIRWNWQATWEPLAMWGKDDYTNQSGKLVTKLHLPRGLVIAPNIGGMIYGLEIRRDSESEIKQYGKFYQVYGGSKPLAYCVGADGLPVVICESALDAALIYQETGGAYQCIASMGYGKTLPRYHVGLIQKAPAVYYVPDNDKGGEDAVARILADFPRANITPPPAGIKDPTELAKRHFEGQGAALPTVSQWLASVGLIQGEQQISDTPKATEPPSYQASEPTEQAQGEGPEWNGERIDGNPCCMWPVYIQGIMKAQGLSAYATDLKGYGIPSHGLPFVLQGFGKNGWRVVDVHGGNGPLELIEGRNGSSNLDGCKAYLKLHESEIRKASKQWEAYTSFYGG